MLSWIAQTITELISWIPSWLYVEGSARYLVVRGMLGLGLIVLVFLVLALRPDRFAIDCYRRYRNSKNAEPGS